MAKSKYAAGPSDGRQVLLDIYQPDEFFGESAFLKFCERLHQSQRDHFLGILNGAALAEDCIVPRQVRSVGAFWLIAGEGMVQLIPEPYPICAAMKKTLF